MKKKKTVAVLLVAVMLLTAVGCGLGYTKEQLVGTWKVTAAKGNSDVKNLIGTKMTFTSGDLYMWTYSSIPFMNGKYRVGGSSL